MRLGVHYANFSHPGDLTTLLTDTARTADEGGVSLFTVMDHWFQMEVLGGPSEPMLEGYTTLGYLAAVTERVRLGLLVTGTTYRHPGLLAKTVTTLDVLSRGRALLGIGAAWYDREHAGLGVPFPPLAERYERLDETLRVCRQMWSDDDGAFHGTHYDLAETVCVPAPVRGDVPVLIGGSGERKTLRLVARHAQACNLFGEGPGVVAHKLDVLRGHCDAEGTDYDAIEKTVIASSHDPATEPDAFLAEAEAYAGLGVSLLTTTPRGDDPVGWTASVCDRVVPRLADL